MRVIAADCVDLDDDNDGVADGSLRMRDGAPLADFDGATDNDRDGCRDR
jgi:hypothetical protein